MAKIKGNCSAFKRWNGSSWEQICQVYSISGIGIEFEEIENDSFLDCKTSLNQSDRCFSIREKETGSGSLKNPTLDLGFDPEVDSSNETNQHLLIGDVKQGTQTYYMITFPNEEKSGIIFYGRPKMFEVPDLTPDEFVHSNWEFLITKAIGDLGFIYVDDVENYTLPTDPVGPVNCN